MKKVITTLIIGAFLGSPLLARDCQYYGEKAQYYMKVAANAISKQPYDWCGSADALEQVINNLDSARKSCIGGEQFKPLITQYTGYLFTSVKNCGH